MLARTVSSRLGSFKFNGCGTYSVLRALLSTSRCRNFEVLEEPGRVSPTTHIPTHIPRPDNTLVLTAPETKQHWHVQRMRTSSALAREVMDAIARHVRADSTTDALDKVAVEACVQRQCYPSPLLYRGFPKAICTSVNNVVCHGIPDDRPLRRGDILSVDVTVYHDGFHGDCCESFIVGSHENNEEDESVDEEDSSARRLVDCARRCRDEAIAVCGPGVQWREIGRVCEAVAKSEGFCIVPCFLGHGIGAYFHGPPEVFHFGYEGVVRRGVSPSLSVKLPRRSR